MPHGTPHRPRPVYTTGSGHRGLIDGAGQHTRQGSMHSTQSAPAAVDAFQDVLMRNLSEAPKGSKMAEDAARAMLLAETQRIQRADKGKGRAQDTLAPPRPPRSGSTTPTPATMQGQARHASPSPSPEAAIGEIILSLPSSPAFEFDIDPVDELADLYLNLPPSRSSSPPVRTVDPNRLKDPLPAGVQHPQMQNYLASPGPPPSIPLPPLPHVEPATRGQMHRNDPFRGVPLTQNALAIFWRGDTPQMFGLVTYNDPEAGPVAFPVEVMGRATQVIEVPPYWTGRVQKMTGQSEEPATHCELTFDGFAGMTFFRVSYLAGHNGAAVMRTRTDKTKSGSPFRALNHVPQHLCGFDSSGTRVIKPPLALFRPQRRELQKFYRDFFESPDQGQVDPSNNHALQATHEKQVLCEFF